VDKIFWARASGGAPASGDWLEVLVKKLPAGEEDRKHERKSFRREGGVTKGSGGRGH